MVETTAHYSVLLGGDWIHEGWECGTGSGRLMAFHSFNQSSRGQILRGWPLTFFYFTGSYKSGRLTRVSVEKFINLGAHSTHMNKKCLEKAIWLLGYKSVSAKIPLTWWNFCIKTLTRSNEIKELELHLPDLWSFDPTWRAVMDY